MFGFAGGHPAQYRTGCFTTGFPCTVPSPGTCRERWRSTWRDGGACGMAMRWLAARLLRQPQRSGARSTFTLWATGPTMRASSPSSPRMPTRSAAHTRRRVSTRRRASGGFAPRVMRGPLSLWVACPAKSTTRRSIAGFSISPRKWRDACAGSGAGHGRGAGASTRPTSRSAASGRICTVRSTSSGTRSISTSHRPATPRPRSDSSARR